MHFIFLHSHSFIASFIIEAAAKKGGKGARKDRTPSAGAAKKGSAKPGAKKGKKGKWS